MIGFLVDQYQLKNYTRTLGFEAKNIQHLIVSVLFSSLMMSCASQSTIEDYVFSFSAEDSDRVFISAAVFDDWFAVPAGYVGCCLASGGKTAALFQKFYPKKGYFEWYDYQAKVNYKATMHYPENLQEMAASLSDEVEYYSRGVVKSGEPILITSITSDNQVVSWIANNTWGGNVKKRDIIEIGRAKGEVFVPDWLDDPEYSVNE